MKFFNMQTRPTSLQRLNDSRKSKRRTLSKLTSSAGRCGKPKLKIPTTSNIETKRKRKRAASENGCDDPADIPPLRCPRKPARAPDLNALNTEDPIMFEPLGPHIYIYNRPSESGTPGSRVAFNVDSLVDYLVCSGRFQDPVSRLPFSESDLGEIDALATRYGLHKQSVVEAKRRAEADSGVSSAAGGNSTTGGYADARFRADALQGLDRLAGEQVAAMVAQAEEAAAAAAAISLQARSKATTGGTAAGTSKHAAAAVVVPVEEDEDEDELDEDEEDSFDESDDGMSDHGGSGCAGVEGMVDQCQLRLLTEVFPVFADLYAQLYDADPAYARVCMSHYRSFAQGPPNKPYRDPLGLLQMVHQFLRSESQYAEESAAARGGGSGSSISLY